MKPAGNMYKDGTYYKNNPTWDAEDSAWKAGMIHELIQKNKIVVKEVTEVGCGAGVILEELSKKMPAVERFEGYDISPDAIQLASGIRSEKIKFYQQDFLAQETKTDTLLLIDVLEHVEDYFGFIRSLNGRANNYVFHIPLDLSCRTLLKPYVLLQQREAVGHLHYFSRDMIFWLLKDTGYTIVDWHYTKPVTDINKSTSFKQGVKKTLRNISFSLNKRLSDKLWGGYSMLVLAHGNRQ